MKYLMPLFALFLLSSCTERVSEDRKALEMVLDNSNTYLEQRIIDLDKLRREALANDFYWYKIRYYAYDTFEKERINILCGLDTLRDAVQIREYVKRRLYKNNYLSGNQKKWIDNDTLDFKIEDVYLLKKIAKNLVNHCFITAFEEFTYSPLSICNWGSKWTVNIIPEQKNVNFNELFEGYVILSSNDSRNYIELFLGEFNDEAKKHKLYKRYTNFGRQSDVFIKKISEKEIEGWGLKPGYIKLTDELNHCKFKIKPKAKGKQTVQGSWVNKRPDGSGYDILIFEYDYEVK